MLCMLCYVIIAVKIKGENNSAAVCVGSLGTMYNPVFFFFAAVVVCKL